MDKITVFKRIQAQADKVCTYCGRFGHRASQCGKRVERIKDVKECRTELSQRT